LSAELPAEHDRGSPCSDAATDYGNSPDSSIRFH